MAGGPASVHAQVGGADGGAFTEVDLRSWPTRSRLESKNSRRSKKKKKEQTSYSLYISIHGTEYHHESRTFP